MIPATLRFVLAKVECFKDFCDKEVGQMSKRPWLVISAALAVLVSGCGKSAGTSQSSSAPADATQPAVNAVTDSSANSSANSSAASTVKLDGPAAAVQEFLEALRTGNDEKASQMLSTAARQKTAALNRNVTPPASDTARFTVGKVDYVNDDGARVASTWTDLDEQGKPKTDEAVWVLRREDSAWHVAGVAAQVFPGEPPLLLNFEDPQDMVRKQQWVREEIRRRAEVGGLQAQGAEKPEKQEKSVRR
jgi:hypothetical protein